MHANNLTRLFSSGLLALLCALPAVAANLAGNAVFVSGKPTATDPAGSVRELKARDKVFSGDLLETTKGRVQIKFVDGAFISIQPNSRFQVEDYNYASGSDGSEKAVYNLFKGGMRAFTGAIGKKHPDAYKVKTPVATIGIRGTGHNTRVCSGDCTGSDGLPLPDGLYHSTWEGTTYVANDFGTSIVPFGNSVYVQDIDSPAEETNEASQVTAVQPSMDTVEELVEEQGEQVTLEAGEQVNQDGTPDDLDIPDAFPATTQEDVGFGAELNLVAVAPPQPASPDTIDLSLLLQTTTFFGEAGPIGAYGTEVNDGDPGYAALATIDPLSILASTSPDAAEAQALINDAMANPDNDVLFGMFFEDPASIAEFRVDSGIGFGRWTNGKVLLLDDDGGVYLKMLSDDQAVHYIFGNSPAVAALNATGSYEFRDGTSSTTTSGGPINGVDVGLGATEGTINVNFGAGTGDFVLKVSHGLLYTLEGPLLIGKDFPSLFASVGAVATTPTDNCSEDACAAYVEGSFFGQQANRGGPEGAGLEYDIEDGGDVITGVAAFSNVTPPPPTVAGGLQTLIAIEPTLMPDFYDDENAGEGILSGTTVLVGLDRAGENGLAGAIGTEYDETGEGEEEIFTTLLTIDPGGILASNSTDPGVTEAQGLINYALDPGRVDPAAADDAAAVNDVIADPAMVAEYTAGSVPGGDYAYGRWSDGMILFIDENVTPGSIDLGVRTVEADTLADGKNLHWMMGAQAATNFGAGATGTYNLIGGTDSSNTSGGPVGSGVQSGSLRFDFTSLNGEIDDMVVLDNTTTFTVNGGLMIYPDRQNEFYDVGNAYALADTAACGGGVCDTLIDGSFFGALAVPGEDPGGAPVLAGLDYEIILTPFDPGEGSPTVGESIIGNAIFGRSGTADPIPDPSDLTMVPDRSLLGIETNLYRNEFDPDNADGGIVSDTTVFEGYDSAGTYGLAGFFGTEFDEDDSGMGVDETLDILITIDPDGIDTTSGAAKDFLDAARQVDGDLVDDVALDPATVVPGSHYSGNIGSTNYSYGRWTYGRILFVDEILDGTNAGEITVEVDELDPDQYFHYLHGETPDINFGTGATGTYEIVPVYKGTNSTGTHDGIVGPGVQSGSLRFDFTSLNGEIDEMVIDHDQIVYTVNGDLYINPLRRGEFTEADNRVFADTDGGLCDNNSCETIIDGSFFGALDGTGANGAPGLAGLDYEIVTEPFVEGDGNSIIGNAVFSRSGTAALIPDTYTVIPDQGLVAVLPNQDFNPSFPDEFADIGLFYDTSNIVGDDRLNKEGLLTTAGFEFDEDTSETFFVAVTIDPEGTLAVMDADPNVVAARGLIADAQVSDPGLVADVVASPAKLAEYFQGDGFAYGRWADGNVLVVDEDIVGGVPGGNKTVDKIGLSDYQSLAFVTGDSPAAPLEGATGRYTFIGGTQSTTVSGATIGDGVTSGYIDFYFDAIPSGWIDVKVSHLTNYDVVGSMAIDMDNPGLFFDTGVTATTVGGNCDAGCATFIDGGFAGALTGGPGGSPAHAGLEYDIADPVDGILGVAVFERTGDAPAQD